jgi:hypothetical protein
VRTLFVLIKRQVIDNAACFPVAGLFSIALVFAIGTAVFTEDRTLLSEYTRGLLVAAPLVVGTGCWVLGVVQGRIDTSRGIVTVLSLLPVRRIHVIFAQIITGVSVIMIVLAPLGVMGAFLWKLYGPPDWLYRPWVGDCFIGVSLAALACYLVGLQAGLKARWTVSAAISLPSVVIILLLVAARGFGLALIVVLIPLIVALLLQCQISQISAGRAVISTGIIVLIHLAILLGCGRDWCDAWLVNTLAASAEISPSGLLPWQIENDPNVTDPSVVDGGVTLPRPQADCLVCNLSPYPYTSYSGDSWRVRHYLLDNSGIIQYFLSRRRGARTTYSAPAWESQSFVTIVHLDEIEGQLVYRRMNIDRRTNRHTWHWDNTAVVYGGPEGVSKNSDAVGRFLSPTVYFEPGSPMAWDRSARPFIVYERQSRRFYAIDFEKQIVHKGPKVQHSAAEPVEAKLLSESGSFSSVSFRLPSGEGWWWGRGPVSVRRDNSLLPIVSESGRIDLLDLKTLTLSGPAGHLPKVRTFSGSTTGKPSNLWDYDVHVVSFVPSSEQIPNPEIKTGFVGIIAASVSCKGMWASVAVFDDQGRRVQNAFSRVSRSDKSQYSILAAAKYIFESLHPPVLTLASFFSAYSFEARASHRALFVMPNSFAAMVRDRQGNVVVTLAILLLVMLPGLSLAGWLGLKVARDAYKLGLPKAGRRFWLTVTIAFGLAGYITYRLTRPTITLVTCANCGKGRRPDMATCHHCGVKWEIPELTPPAWRVLTHVD